MNRVVHFEIHGTDPEALAAFYRTLFGWQIQKWDGPMDYWTIGTGPDGEAGIDGGLVRRMGDAPAAGQSVNAFVCTVDVADVDATVAQAQALGATVALPKMPIPGMGWLAHVLDPERNILGLMQRDPAAA